MWSRAEVQLCLCTVFLPPSSFFLIVIITYGWGDESQMSSACFLFLSPSLIFPLMTFLTEFVAKWQRKIGKSFHNDRMTFKYYRIVYRLSVLYKFSSLLFVVMSWELRLAIYSLECERPTTTDFILSFKSFFILDDPSSNAFSYWLLTRKRDSSWKIFMDIQNLILIWPEPI